MEEEGGGGGGYWLWSLFMTLMDRGRFLCIFWFVCIIGGNSSRERG